jgi:hypothetical protein
MDMAEQQTITLAEHQAAMENYRKEMNIAMRTNHHLREENKDVRRLNAAMNDTMTEIRDLLQSGQIRDAIDAIDNEQRIFDAQSEPVRRRRPDLREVAECEGIAE